MVRKPAVVVPDGLGSAGSALWVSVRSKYELRPDELVMLETACRAQDRIVAMEETRAGRVTDSGSMGQLVIHPLIPEIRATEAQVSSLLSKLKLPDEAGGEQVSQQRSAAQSRWSSAHGSGA